MRIRCRTRDLNRVLQLAATVVQKTRLVTQLWHAKIEATGQALLRTFNVDVYVTIRFPAEVEESGFAFFPVKEALAIVRHLQDTVAVSGDYSGVTFEDANGSTRVESSMTESGDLPQAPELREENTLVVPFRQFLTALRRVKHAVARRQVNRPGLERIGLFVYEGSSDTAILDVVASDGHRLAWQTVAIEACYEKKSDVRIVMPVELLRIFEKIPTEPAPRQVYAALKHGKAGDYEHEWLILQADSGDFATSVAAFLPDDAYPDWRHVLPESVKPVAYVHVKDILQPLKRIPENVPVEIATDRTGKIRLKSSSGSAEITALSVDKAPLTVTVDSRYLREAIEAVGEKDVVVLSVPSDCEKQPKFLLCATDDGYMALIGTIVQDDEVAPATSGQSDGETAV